MYKYYKQGKFDGEISKGISLVDKGLANFTREALIGTYKKINLILMNKVDELELINQICHKLLSHQTLIIYGT